MKSNTPYLIPSVAVGAVLFLALLLMLEVVWRPWSGPNNSWKTYLNLENAVPQGYTRTLPAYTGKHGPQAVWVPSAAAAPEEEGRFLFTARMCAMCHGIDARGGVFAADIRGQSASTVIRAARNPLGKMPAFTAADVSDEELQKIAAYLASLGPTQAEGAPGEGLQVFRSYCTTCHTIGGGRKVGPDLAGVGARRSPEWLASFIRQPQSVTPGSPMPAFESVLTATQLEAIVTYLSSLK